MNKRLHHYVLSRDLFRPGESVYINMATESPESHLHAHDFIEIAYVASGVGTHTIGESEYNVSKGDLFVINYDVPHEFRSLPDLHEPRLTVYNCIFTPEFLDYKLVDCRDFHELAQHLFFQSLFPNEDNEINDIVLSCGNYAEIENLYEKMLNEYRRQQAGYTQLLRAYIIELLVLAFRLYKNTIRSEDRVNYSRRELIKNVISYMRENFNKDLRLEELSLMSFFSRNYFCRLFKETTGMTVTEYIQKMRIEKACTLLKTTDKTVLDISQHVGYKDIKFFNELFRRNTGKTPGTYRKKNLLL